VIRTDGNNRYEDVVGPPSDVVDFYRRKNRTPCGFTAIQTITIDCYHGAQVFATNPLQMDIGDKTVTISRANVSKTTVWGISQTEYRARAAEVVDRLLLRKPLFPRPN
jgi:hypothetical protein